MVLGRCFLIRGAVAAAALSFLSVGNVAEDAEANVFREAKIELLGLIVDQFPLCWSGAETRCLASILPWHRRSVSFR
jgi:hypothetical protein